MAQQRLVLLTALYVVVFCNGAFFRHVLEVYPLSLKSAGFLLSLVIVLLSLHVFLFTLASSRWTTKPILMVVLVVSAATSYFATNLGTVMDRNMIQNIMETDAAEALDLLTPGLGLSVLVVGVLPAILIYCLPVEYAAWPRELFRRSRALVASILVIALSILAFSANYASMFREHKRLRYYANPAYLMYSIGDYASSRLASTQAKTMTPVGLDARIPATDTDRELIILVIGETVRSDHLSLNGYAQRTNPLLETEDVFSFPHVTSCDTSTAISVPCMFSPFAGRLFRRGSRGPSENALDVLRKAKVNVLWRDNNSTSKGVADRIRYEDFRSPATNPVCDIECRDIGMLAGLLSTLIYIFWFKGAGHRDRAPPDG